MPRNFRKKNKKYKFFIKFIIVMYLFITGMYTGINLYNNVQDNNIQDNNVQNNNEINLLLQEGNLVVSFIDVGQGDSILIEAPTGEKMLIDAGGTKENASYNYIKQRGIDTLDIIVITHPHSDHILEISNIISNFNVNKIYMPNVSHTSKTFEDMIDTIIQNDITVLEAKAGVYIDFAPDITCLIVGPNSNEYTDLNNYSTVLHLTYKDNKFLFTGDAEFISENEILQNNFDIQANVLKVGHHGSSTSTSQEFLDKINPEYAIISAGENNSYGHPHQVTLNNLNKRGIKTYITAEQGNIILGSNGYDISLIN